MKGGACQVGFPLLALPGTEFSPAGKQSGSPKGEPHSLLKKPSRREFRHPQVAE